MKYKDKLIELLKEVPEIKKDLEELRFGCNIKDTHLGGVHKLIENKDGYKNLYIEGKGIYGVLDTNIEIIGNPLGDRHLRLYCKKNGLEFFFTNNSLLIGTNKIFGINLELNDLKPFHNQSDDFREKLYKFLTKV